MADVTRIIQAIQQGDRHATDELLPVVYEELRMLAAQRMSQEAPGQTLQATALVHEAYLRLVGGDEQHWDGRGHFFAAAAEAMRRILIDSARQKRTVRHGGGRQRVDLESLGVSSDSSKLDVLDVNAALEKLTAHDPEVADLVKLYYFAGLTIDQVAQLKGISRRTAGKHLTYARAWLHREITQDGAVS